MSNKCLKESPLTSGPCSWTWQDSLSPSEKEPDSSLELVPYDCSHLILGRTGPKSASAPALASGWSAVRQRVTLEQGEEENSNWGRLLQGEPPLPSSAYE